MNCFNRKVLNIISLMVFFLSHIYASNPPPVPKDAETIGDVAANLTYQIADMHDLIIVTAYVAGFGFMMASMFKFKQHRDNPQQVPIGGGVALFVVAVLLVFMPALYKPTQESIYGSLM